MINLQLFLATAIGLGVAYAAAPGAVNIEAIRLSIAAAIRWGRCWIHP